MTINEFRVSVINEFRKQGYIKQIYNSFDEVLTAVSSLLKICIEFFIREVSELKSPHDLFAFIVNYSATNTSDPNKIAFKHLCKSIFVLSPNLRLDSNAPHIFPETGEADIETLMGIHYCMMDLTQIFGILITYQQEIGTLFVSDDAWSFHFNENEVALINRRFQKAVMLGALNKYCDDDFVAESFIDNYRNVFKTIETQLYNRIFNRPFFYDCDSLTEQQFIQLLTNIIPQRGIIEVTDIVLANRDHPCIGGLVFEEKNSNLFMALTKPHNKLYRARFRPLMQLNIDGETRYFTTQSIYFEAISEIGHGHYAHNELPKEWSSIRELKNAAKDIFKRHSDFLEENVASLINSKYKYLKNVKSLSGISCVNAPAVIDAKVVPGKKVGEIDFIIIDDSNKIIYVVDAKYLKPTFYYPSFATDADKFRKVGGYEEKLSFKIAWVANNINLLCRELKRKDFFDYNIDGFFVTDNLIYYTLISKYPIIPISNVIDYLNSKDRFCFLPTL